MVTGRESDGDGEVFYSVLTEWEEGCTLIVGLGFG